MRAVLESRSLEELPLKLLTCGLEAHGDQLDTDSLDNWLGVGACENGDWNSQDREVRLEIRQWMAQRPEVQQAIFMEGLERCPESDEVRLHARKVRERLYKASPPPAFGRWCLVLQVQLPAMMLLP